MNSLGFDKDPKDTRRMWHVHVYDDAATGTQ